MSRTIKSIVCFFLFLSPTFLAAQTLKFKHPDQYTVLKGDTLWDISETFFQDPWVWPNVWKLNQNIKNPHLIYPGDTVYLNWVNGLPRLSLTRAAVRLSPIIKQTPQKQAVPILKAASIAAFLSNNHVLSKKQVKHLPYILAGREDRKIFASTDAVYATLPTQPAVGSVFGSWRIDGNYVSAKGKKLGKHASQTGVLQVEQYTGGVAKLRIIESKQEVKAGDYIAAMPEIELPVQVFPAPVSSRMNASIIKIENDMSFAGNNAVVAIDAGVNQSLKQGDLLAIMQRGRTVKNRKTNRRQRLPDKSIGVLMVYKTYSNMSHALILSASEPIKSGAKLSTDLNVL